jgi:hypothetical protein
MKANNSFKPNLLRYTTTQVSLTQAFGRNL